MYFTMKNSLLNLKKNLFLTSIILIAVTLIFRKVATILIIISLIFFLVYNRYLLKDNFKKASKFIIIICIPIILEIIFFWNNDSFIEGYKSLEKNLTTLIFPFVLILNYKLIQPKKILNYYSLITILTLIVSLFLFIVFRNDYFHKYMDGIHLWQMGYEFSNFIGIHAPALNMYISFVSIFFFYIFLKEYSLNKLSKKATTFFAFLLISFLFLLIVNTRIALLTFLINIIVVFFSFQMKIKTKLTIFFISLFLFITVSFIFVKKFPYFLEKYTTQIVGNLDKIGELDKIENPEIMVYSSLVTRLSIWKSSYELGKDNFWIGVGSSDAKKELTNYYKRTDQQFLKKYGFITHNQFLNYFLKYGIFGIIGCVIYLLYPLYIYWRTKNIIVLCFFVNFFISNFTDDYLNKFDGIAYSALWYSIFTCYIIKNEESKKN